MNYRLLVGTFALAVSSVTSSIALADTSTPSTDQASSTATADSASAAQTSTSASGFGAGLKVGTNGMGFDLGYAFNPYFGMRAGWGALSFSKNLTESGYEIHGKFRLNAIDLLMDYHPWGEMFHLTAGLDVLNNTHFSGDAVRAGNGTITLNGHQYDSSTLASADGDAKWSGARPYLGLGWDSMNRQSPGFFFTSDLGVAYIGSPKVNITTNCIANNAMICSMVTQDAAVQEQKVKNNLNSYQWLPVVQVGFGYRF